MEDVAIYLRKSREDERNHSDEDTLARHERMLLNFCKYKGYNVKHIYREVTSANKLSKQLEALKMIEDIYDNLYDGIVVVDKSRITRGNEEDSEFIYRTLKETKTKLITPTEIYDPGQYESFDDFEESFLEERWFFDSFFNRLELKTIIKRFTRGRHQAQKEGYFIGTNISFGYRKERLGRGFVLIPDENSKYVKEIYKKYVIDDISISEIRDWLNTLNLTTSSYKKNKWDISRVYRILKNKTYLGYIRAQTYNKDTALYFKGKHKPLITEEIFNLAQEKLKNNYNIKLSCIPLNNPFENLLYCKNCHNKMDIKKINIPKSKIYKLFCSNCLKEIFLDRFEQEFLNNLQKDYQEYLSYILELIEKKDKMDILDLAIKKKDDKVLLKALNKQLKLLNQKYKKGLIKDEIYKIRLDNLKKRLAKINIDDKNSLDLNLDFEIGKYKDLCLKIKDILNKYQNIKSVKEKNKLLNKYFKMIQFDVLTDKTLIEFSFL